MPCGPALSYARATLRVPRDATKRGTPPQNAAARGVTRSHERNSAKCLRCWEYSASRGVASVLCAPSDRGWRDGTVGALLTILFPDLMTPSIRIFGRFWIVASAHILSAHAPAVGRPIG
jgi:hypothetical protein